MTSNGGGDVPISNGDVHENNEGAVQVTSCDRCKELEEELEKRRREHTFYSALKKKITLTDSLIKKYNGKCKEFEQQKKKLEDVTFRLASSRRDCKVLEEHLAVTLKEVIPWKRGKDKFLKDLEECQTKLRDTQEKLEGSEASCVQFKNGFFEMQEKLDAMEDKQSDLKKAAEKSKQAEKKMSALNTKIKGDLTDCKRVLKNARNREARITTKYQHAKNRVAELVSLLRNHGVPVPKVCRSLLRGSASGQEGTSTEDTDLDVPEDSFSPPDNTPSPVRPAHPQRDLKLTGQKNTATTPAEVHLKRIFERFALEMPVSISALPPSPYPVSVEQDIGVMSDSSSDVSRGDGSNDEAFSDVADQIELQLNMLEEESPPKESPLKESPPKESLPKDSPLKETPPKESPRKDSLPKDSPLKESPPKESSPKESPTKTENMRMQLRQTPQRKAKAQKLEEAKYLHDDSDRDSSPEPGFNRRRLKLKAKKPKTPKRKPQAAIESLSDSESESDSPLKEVAPQGDSTGKFQLKETKFPIEKASNREVINTSSDENRIKKEKSFRRIKSPAFSGTLSEDSDDDNHNTTITSPKKSSLANDKISFDVKPPSTELREIGESRDIEHKNVAKDMFLLSPDRRITRSQLKTLIEQGGTAPTETPSLDATPNPKASTNLHPEHTTSETPDFCNSVEKDLDCDKVQNKLVGDVADSAKLTQEQLKQEETFSPPRRPVTRSVSHSDSGSQEMTLTSPLRATPERLMRSNSSPGVRISRERPSQKSPSEVQGKEGQKSPALTSPIKLKNSKSVLEQSTLVDKEKVQTDSSPSHPGEVKSEEMSPRKLLRSVSAPVNKPDADSDFEKSANTSDSGSTRRITRSQTLTFASPVGNDAFRRVTRSSAHNLSSNLDVKVLPQKTSIVTSRKSRKRSSRSPNGMKDVKPEPKMMTPNTPNEQRVESFARDSKKDTLSDSPTADEKPDLKLENLNQSTISLSSGTTEERTFDDESETCVEAHPDETKPSTDAIKLQKSSEIELANGQDGDSSKNPLNLMPGSPKTKEGSCGDKSIPTTCKVEPLLDHSNALNDGEVQVSAETRLDVSIKVETEIDLPSQNTAFDFGGNCAPQEPTNEIQADLKLEEFVEPELHQLENGEDTKMQQGDTTEEVINLPESPTEGKTDDKAAATSIKSEEHKTNTLSSEDKCNSGEQGSSSSVASKEGQSFHHSSNKPAKDKTESDSGVLYNTENTNHVENVDEDLNIASMSSEMAANKNENSCEEVFESHVAVSDHDSSSALTENCQQPQLKPCNLEVVQLVENQETGIKTDQHVMCMEAESSRASTPTTDVISMAGHVSPVSPLSLQSSRPVSPLSLLSRSPPLLSLSPKFDSLINIPRMISPLPLSPETSDLESVDEMRRPASLEGITGSAFTNQPRMISPLFPTPVPPAVSPLLEATMPNALSPLSDTPPRPGHPSALDPSPRNPLIPSPCNFHSEAPRDALSVRPQHSTSSGKQASRCLASSFTTTNATASPNPNIISPRLRSLATEMASEFGDSHPSTSKVKRESQNTASSGKTKDTEAGHPTTDSLCRAKTGDAEKAGQHLFKHGLVNVSKKSSKTPNTSWQTAFVQNLKTSRHSRTTADKDPDNKETCGKSQRQMAVSKSASEVKKKDHLASVETRHKNSQDSGQNSAQEMTMPRVTGKRKENKITEASSEDVIILDIDTQVKDDMPRRSTRSHARDGAISPKDCRQSDSKEAEMTGVRDESGIERDSELAGETPRKRRKFRHTSSTEVSVEDARPKTNKQGTRDGGIPASEEQDASDLRRPSNQSKRPSLIIPALEIKTSGFKKPGSGKRQPEVLQPSQKSKPLVEEKVTADGKQKLEGSLIRSTDIDASKKKVGLDSNISEEKKPLKCEENFGSMEVSPQASMSHSSTVDVKNNTGSTKTPDVKSDPLTLKQPALALHPVSVSSNQQKTPLLEVKPRNDGNKATSKPRPSKTKSNIGNIWGDIASRREPGIAIFNRGKSAKKKIHNSSDSDNGQSHGTLTEPGTEFTCNSESKTRDDHSNKTNMLISQYDSIRPCDKTPKLPTSVPHSNQFPTVSPDFPAITSPPSTHTSSQAQEFPSVVPKPEELPPTSQAFHSETLSSMSASIINPTEKGTKEEQNLTAIKTKAPPCLTSQSHVTAFSSEKLPEQTSNTTSPQFKLPKQNTKWEQTSTPKCAITASPSKGEQSSAGRSESRSLDTNLCTVEMRPTGKMAIEPMVSSSSKTDSESRKRVASQQDDVSTKNSPCKQPKMTELPHTLESEAASVSKVKSPVKGQQPIFSNIQKRLKELRSQTNVKPLIATVLTYLGDEAITLMPAIHAKCLARNTSTKPLLLPSEEQIVACILDSALSSKTSGMSMLLTCLCRGARTPPNTLTKTKPSVVVCASFCRVFTALGRHLGFLDRVRVFCYDLLHEDFPNAEELLLNIAVTWPDALMNKEGMWSPLCTAIEVVTMQRLIQAASPQNLQVQEIIHCFSVLCQWRIPGANVPAIQCRHFVKSMQDTNITRLQSTGTPTKTLSPESYEVVRAVELLAFHLGWQWTNDHLVRDQLWPVLKTWSQEVLAANAAAAASANPTSATINPTSATTSGAVPTRQQESARLKPGGIAGSCVESPADASACAVMKVIGGVATIGLSSNKQSVFELLKMLAAVLQQPSASVPWTVQVFTAEAILSLSPSDPTFALEVMQRWRSNAIVTIPRKLENKLLVLTKVTNHMNTASW